MTEPTDKLPAPARLNIERWLGRREAFGMIAGRCSAADVECLRQIRESKRYLDMSRNWDDFCRVHLNSSRHRIDNAIRQLEDHGPQFFHATEHLRLTEAEYCAIKDHVTETGLLLEGETLLWNQENGQRITEALGKLRAVAAPKRTAKPVTFEILIERFQVLSEQLEQSRFPIDDRQRMSLGNVLIRLSNLASRRGVVLVQR
jgi:hypothetical protein